MHVNSAEFPRRSVEALLDPQLQRAMNRAKSGFMDKRRLAVEALPEFAALQQAARGIKEHTLANLDHYLEHFERQVKAAGGQVHWAATPEEATRTVVDICRRAEARLVTKSKSMVGEEIGLNEALEAAGLEPVETDLGEYIIQLAGEPPSHIIAPAVHKTKEQIAGLFHAHHRRYGLNRRLSEVPEMVDEARTVLRKKFISADVGITGANFLVAETGSSVLVTNEGNGDLTATLPRVHIVTAGIEKLLPTLEDTAILLRLLARSATGQEMSVYTTFATGPARSGDPDGPGEYHVVLLDNGRSRMLGGEYREMLRCIRCGACMNHCPVYQSVGGHAYGWVYPGPMGSVLTPLIVGLEKAAHLPNACTLNGRCQMVCPMQIPLPGLLRKLRREEFASGLTPARFRAGLWLWAFLARRPRWYRRVSGWAMKILARLAGSRRSFHTLPLAGGWTASRDFPAPAGETFQNAWHRTQGSAPRE